MWRLEFIEGEQDLPQGLFGKRPFEGEAAEATHLEALAKRKEKFLVYCAFPLVDSVPQPSRLPAKIGAPLLFYPARFDNRSKGYALSIEAAGQQVNVPILAFSAIFGMKLEPGFGNKPAWLFWLFVAIGILIGMLMTTLVVRKREERVSERKIV